MRSIFLTKAILLSLAPLLSLGVGAALAQMVLPGAVGAPTPVGQAGAPPAVARRPAIHSGPEGDVAFDRHFIAAKPPSTDGIVGKPFAQFGSRGVLQVEQSGDDLVVSRLTMSGDKISQPNQACQLQVGGGAPLRLKPLGTPEGVQRFEIDSSACPLQFDVLNGAVRVISSSGACVFREADCGVDASGLWGPPGDSFSESQKKTIERERTVLEKNTREHFRMLMSRFKKDKPAAQSVVREQAAFSANRSQNCRDYDREDAHGFCALRLTEARDYGLQTRLAAEASKKDRKKDPKIAARAPVVRTTSPKMIEGVKILPAPPSTPAPPRDESAPKISPRGLY
jgi:hypothetical protein